MFVFHYSGHGDVATVDGNIVNLIGTPSDSVNSDVLVRKLASIVPDCCTLLMTIDACGSGSFEGSLARNRGSMQYGVVLTTNVATDANSCPRAFFDTGNAVKEGLGTAAALGTADTDKNGTITVTELVSDVSHEPRHGFHSVTFWDDAHAGYPVSGSTFMDLDPPPGEDGGSEGPREEVPSEEAGEDGGEAPSDKPSEEPPSDKPSEPAKSSRCSVTEGSGGPVALLVAVVLLAWRRRLARSSEA